MSRWAVGGPLAPAALALAALVAVGCVRTEEGHAGGGRARDAASDTPYPFHTIEIVSWASPGGPTDVLSRTLARVGEKHFGGERIDVSNREGGAGAATMQYLSGHAGDGHVLAAFTASGTVNMATGRIPFGPEDFTPILRVQLDPFLIAVRQDSPFHTLADFFEAARAHPGDVSISGFGAASAHFLGFSRLAALAGDPDIRWIAYPGSADAAVAALGGHTDAVHSNYNTIREHLRAGTMRVLGVALPIAALPGVATYAEQGYDVAPVHWRGVVGPPGLSPELVADIRGRLLATIHDPDFEAYMKEAAMSYAVMADADAFGAWMAEEVASNRAELQRLGLLEAGRP